MCHRMLPYIFAHFLLFFHVNSALSSPHGRYQAPNPGHELDPRNFVTQPAPSHPYMLRVLQLSMYKPRFFHAKSLSEFGAALLRNFRIQEPGHFYFEISTAQGPTFTFNYPFRNGEQTSNDQRYAAISSKELYLTETAYAHFTEYLQTTGFSYKPDDEAEQLTRQLKEIYGQIAAITGRSKKLSTKNLSSIASIPGFAKLSEEQKALLDLHVKEVNAITEKRLALLEERQRLRLIEGQYSYPKMTFFLMGLKDPAGFDPLEDPHVWFRIHSDNYKLLQISSDNLERFWRTTPKGKGGSPIDPLFAAALTKALKYYGLMTQVTQLYGKDFATWSTSKYNCTSAAAFVMRTLLDRPNFYWPVLVPHNGRMFIHNFNNVVREIEAFPKL